MFSRPLVFWMILAMAGLGHCATLDRKAAGSLADAGTRTADTLGEYFLKLANRWNVAVASNAILANFPAPGQAPIPPLSPAEIKNIRKIQRSYNIRAQVFHRLSDTYRAFGDLARYDAQKEFASSLNETASAIDNYRSLVGQAPIPESVRFVATEVGGLLVEYRHSEQTKKASQSIKGELIRIGAVLKAEKKMYASNERLITDTITNAALSFYRLGFSSPRGIIKDTVTRTGLDYDRERIQATLKKLREKNPKQHAKFQASIVRIIRFRADQRIANQQALLNSQIESVRRLIAEHKELEKGGAINVRNVTTLLLKLQRLSSEYERLRAGERDRKSARQEQLLRIIQSAK